MDAVTGGKSFYWEVKKAANEITEEEYNDLIKYYSAPQIAKVAAELAELSEENLKIDFENWLEKILK